MRDFKFLLILVTSLTLFSCEGSRSTGGEPRANQKKVAGVCEKEADLMAAGIVHGDVVNKGDPDDKNVVMILSANTICTAAPITDGVLVTAAHCVTGDPAGMVAVFYPSLSCESGFDITKYSIRISKIARHSGYDLSVPVDQRTDDIALVFLKSSIPAGYPIYQIADPEKVDLQAPMWLYGYGIVGEKRGGRGILRKTFVEMSRVTVDPVQKKIRVDQHDSTGFCMGDSGGPGLVTINSKLQILGVNSYVNGVNGDICNNLGFQTLVHPYLDWIEFQKAGYK